MSETCYYHPEVKAKSNCPECTLPICDRCRLEGDMQRCASCALASEAGEALDDAHAHAPMQGGADHDEYAQPMCTNHDTLAADMQCLNCFRPFCLSCASTGYCPDCAPQFVNRQNAAQMAPAVPHRDLAEVSYDFDEEGPGAFDLAGSYMEDSAAPAARAPRPRKRPEGTGNLPKKGGQGGKTGPLGKNGKGAPAKKGGKSDSKLGMIAGAVVLLLALGGGAYWYMTPHGAAPDDNTPMTVSIVSPKGPTLHGVETIKLKVAAGESIDRIDVLVDGKKYGAPFRANGPFETDWATNLGFPNGKHKLKVLATYTGGQTAQASQDYQIQNK